MTQCFHWSAVKPQNPLSIFNGIRPIFVGVIKLLTQDCIQNNLSVVNVLHDFHSFNMCFAEPNRRLCIGSTEKNDMESKYGNLVSSPNQIPSACSSLIFSACVLAFLTFKAAL